MQQPAPPQQPQPPVDTGPMTIGKRFKAFKEKNHIAFEVAFFMAGFAFDAVLLHRIDNVALLIHQALYLVLTFGLIAWDHRIFVDGKEPTGKILGRIAGVRLWVMHFFLGTLLNAFMVFYFKASSGIWSFMFITALMVVMIVNELPKFRKRGPVVRVALLSFASTSYMAYLLPIALGYLHWGLFLASVLFGIGVTIGMWKAYTKITHDPNWTFDRAVAPGLAVQALLLALYFLHVVPPVPLSLKYIGIFQDVTKPPKGDPQEFPCSYRPTSFFRHDATEFLYRESEGRIPDMAVKAYAFVAVFAPSRFNDTLTFNWEYDDPKRGWISKGRYRASLGKGQLGRDEGFRTWAYTWVSKPGDYRVIIRSSDEREIGRKNFEVVKDSTNEPYVQSVVIN
jgi:hypothetical protein